MKEKTTKTHFNKKLEDPDFTFFDEGEGTDYVWVGDVDLDQVLWKKQTFK